MGKGIKLIGAIMVTLFVFQMGAHAQQKGKQAKLPDTNGFADIESRLNDFKFLAQEFIGKINRSGSLDSIKQFAVVLDQMSDTLINHMAPIFDSFNNLHPQQYIPLRNISDISDAIIKTKDINKAKKYGQKMSIEYSNLEKAK